MTQPHGRRGKWDLGSDNGVGGVVGANTGAGAGVVPAGQPPRAPIGLPPPSAYHASTAIFKQISQVCTPAKSVCMCHGRMQMQMHADVGLVEVSPV